MRHSPKNWFGSINETAAFLTRSGVLPPMRVAPSLGLAVAQNIDADTMSQDVQVSAQWAAHVTELVTALRILTAFSLTQLGQQWADLLFVSAPIADVTGTLSSTAAPVTSATATARTAVATLLKAACSSSSVRCPYQTPPLVQDGLSGGLRTTGASVRPLRVLLDAVFEPDTRGSGRNAVFAFQDAEFVAQALL